MPVSYSAPRPRSAGWVPRRAERHACEEGGGSVAYKSNLRAATRKRRVTAVQQNWPNGPCPPDTSLPRPNSCTLKELRTTWLVVLQERSIRPPATSANKGTKTCNSTRNQRLTGHFKTKAMKLGLFGGTFDPIHRGHIALAQAAREKFGLNSRAFSFPAHIPPHKQKQPLSAFAHRYAMVVLATAGDKALFPLIFRSSRRTANSKTRSDVTIKSASRPAGRQLHHRHRPSPQTSLKKIDQLFFLIGDRRLPRHREVARCRTTLREVEFIVASVPGYSLADVANSLPERLRPAVHITKPFEKQPAAAT